MLCEARLKVEEKMMGKSSTGKIEATVTTWGAREGADGRRFNYQPEGFMDWANEFAKSGKPLPMFVNHQDESIPVGQWESFAFTPEGMTASGKLFTNTTSGSDLYNVMSESPNMFGGVSVSAYADEYMMVDDNGDPVEDPEDPESYFSITKGGLKEVSVVMYPNNLAAEVSSLEYIREDGSPILKNLEQALRDATSLSRKDAVKAVSIFKEVLTQRDAKLKPIEKPETVQSESAAEVNEQEILDALNERELLKSLTLRIQKAQSCQQQSLKN
jgi:phage head maturation protease